MGFARGWWDVPTPTYYAADQYRYFHGNEEVEGLVVGVHFGLLVC